ncbi:MAG: OmpA family protein [Microscillaceae bacterium]|nr:OmpA family protein [Microscillaceae bacterium]MDW8459577.1 OmpA family protein [Cytophagales bacterium]
MLHHSPKISLLIIFYWVVSLPASAQTYYTKSKKAIKEFEQAQALLTKRQYKEGIEKLNNAIRIDNSFADAHYKLATTYQVFREDSLAYYHFERTIIAQPTVVKYALAHYYTGESYLRQGKYEQAKMHFQNYLNLKPNQANYEKEAQRLVACCNFALEALKNPLPFNPQPLNSEVNQFALQYSPVVSADGLTLIYTARKALDGANRDENIYVAEWKNNDWTNIKPISPNINTLNSEGTCTISADGKMLVFTGCENTPERRSLGKCDLYFSRKVGTEWTKPVNLGANINSPAWESQPSLSADGKKLFFVSDRAGGLGRMDIYMSTLNEKGEWTPAVNLGENINTPYDESAPFIHVSGKTLYFSSKGHIGFGGEDLYKSEWDEATQQWQKPQNLGYPINNHEDQFSIFITSDGTKAYYAVEKRKNGRLASSLLYSFDLPQTAKPKQVSNFVKGTVKDAQTNAPLEAIIELINLANNQKENSVTSDKQNGSYLIVLNQGSEYALKVAKQGYSYKSLTFNYTETQAQEMKPVEIDILLEPLKVGVTFRLNNIFFEYGKYTLQEKSKSELNELIQFMKDNPNVKGEISGHTDNIGNETANQQLSLNRAKAVFDYLTQNGIEAKRLTYKGYGSSKPDAPNDTEENRAKNRRIEFKIIE